jgi:hypothetical protein
MSDDKKIIDLDERRNPPATAEEKAEDYKCRTIETLGDLVELMRAAEREDFRIEFAIQRDQMGVPFYTGPNISKRFT